MEKLGIRECVDRGAGRSGEPAFLQTARSDRREIELGQSHVATAPPTVGGNLHSRCSENYVEPSPKRVSLRPYGLIRSLLATLRATDGLGS